METRQGDFGCGRWIAFLGLVGVAIGATGCYPYVPADTFKRIVGTLATGDGGLIYDCSMSVHDIERQVLEDTGPVGGNFKFTLQNPPSHGKMSVSFECKGFGKVVTRGPFDFGDFSYEQPLEIGVITFAAE